MPSTADQVIARFDEFENRTSRRLRALAETRDGRAAMRRRQLRGTSSVRAKAIRLAAIALATGVGLIVFTNLFGGIGIDGFLLLMIGLAIAAATVMFWPAGKEPEPTQDEIRNAELAALPLRVERWLEKRRPDLPATAQRQVDELLLRLEVLAAQLAKVSANAPVVADARKLIGEELPPLVESYLNVPPSYRTEGADADRQLHEGLDTISGELQRLSEQLARGDLDRLAIEGRFLEVKYRGEGGSVEAGDSAGENVPGTPPPTER